MNKLNSNTSPILNNPYDEPKLHYDVTLEGNLDYSKILEGRRPYSANLTVMPNTLNMNIKRKKRKQKQLIILIYRYL